MVEHQLVGEEVLTWVVLYCGLFAEAVAVAIILYAVLQATWHIVRTHVNRRNDPHPWLTIRFDLARSLALALEFLLAADIVRTAVAPTWDEIGKLAAVAVIRTGLNFFLHREMQQGEADDGRAHLSPGLQDEDRTNLPSRQRHLAA